MTAATVYHSLTDGSRASFGGDEYVFVEVDVAMSLDAALRVQSMAREIAALRLSGVIDVAPANASYLIRIDPDLADPREILAAVGDVHRRSATAEAVIETEIVDIPVLYDDPWSREVCSRSRDAHQSPAETDIEFVARINGFDTVADLVHAHTSAPFIVTFPCFKPGNAESFQLVGPHRQIEAPKYLTPRTETPARAVAHGGAFTVIYPTDGVGGYQLLGRAAVPVVDLYQVSPIFATSPVLTPISTLISFRAVDRSEYDDIECSVSAGHHVVARRPVTFSMDRFRADTEGYARSLKELLA